jgi:hypothetical protein
VISHSFLATTNWILPADTPRSFPPFLPCLASQFRQGRVASVPPAPHPPIKGLPIPKSFPPIPSSQVVVHVVPLHYILFQGCQTPTSRVAPKCQCQSPRKTNNVNLLAKIPVSISSHKSHGQSPRQTNNVNVLAKIPMTISSQKIQKSISSPKSQCQSPRQTPNVNLLAKIPMSISSPNYQCHSPRQTSNVTLLAKLTMSISSPNS